MYDLEVSCCLEVLGTWPQQRPATVWGKGGQFHDMNAYNPFSLAITTDDQAPNIMRKAPDSLHMMRLCFINMLLWTFQGISGILIFNGCQLFNHPCGILCCMAVSFATIPGASYPAWLWASQPSLERTYYLAWLWHGSEHFKHLWDILSCMAVSFSTISGTSYPAWLWACQRGLEQPMPHGAFQSSLGQPILHGCELANPLWNNLCCMAVNYSNIYGILILHGRDLFNHLWNNLRLLGHRWGILSGMA